jgi:acyl-CoA reductase-like NAD-dependent aldehyde dehydrogenase
MSTQQVALDTDTLFIGGEWVSSRGSGRIDVVSPSTEETAHRVSMQNGMPIAISRQLEAVFPAVVARYYAGLIRSVDLDEERAGLLGGRIRVARKPVGVIAAIVPWNHPQTLAMFKLAPAIAMGCTIVMKPSPETVLDSLLLAVAAEEAGFPPVY